MTGPYDVVSIGSAVVDVILKSSQFSPHNLDGELMLCEVYGGKADVEYAEITSGGAGTNTAVAFARQGLRSAVVAEIGSDFQAQLIVDELKRENVDTKLLVEEPEEQTGLSAILVANDGSRSAMTFRGAAKQLNPSDIPFSLLQKVPWIHLSSIGNPDLIRQIFLFCKEHSIKLSWNPGKNELEDIIKHSVGDFSGCCSVVFVNEIEFSVFENQRSFMTELTDMLVVTRGKKGGEIYSPSDSSEPLRYEGKEVKAVCELGAGDAFASGFVGALLQNHPLEKAIDWGVQNGASVVSFMSAKKGLLSFS